jgi:hypothetical protein
LVQGKRRRFTTWQQALLLLVIGIAIAYPSFEHWNIWGGGTPDKFDGWDLLGVFVGLILFISGCASFLLIAVKAVTSSGSSGPVVAAQSRAAPGASARNSLPQHPSDTGTKRLTTVPGSTTLTGLCITLVAAIVFITIELLLPGNRPRHSSMFGQYYLLHSGLSFLLSQLPYAVALIRTWKEQDRAGIALAVFVGASQVLATLPFFALLRYPYAAYDHWPWLNASLGLAVVAFAILAWRAAPSREGDVGLLVSMFFGLIIYTGIAQIALEILSSRVRV